MGERLNIKNMIIEPDRRPEQPFDPARDITAEDWKTMSLAMDNFRREGRWDRVVHLARHFVILGQTPHLQVSDWDHFRGDFEQLRKIEAANLALGSDAAEHAMLGERPVLSQVEEERLQVALKADLDQGLYTAVERTVDQVILGMKPSIDERVLTMCRANLNLEDELIWKAVEDGANLRILGQKVPIDAGRWQTFRNYLNKLRADVKDRPLMFLGNAAKLAILAADEVKIPPGGGLELVWQKDIHKPETPALPEQRRF